MTREMCQGALSYTKPCLWTHIPEDTSIWPLLLIVAVFAALIWWGTRRHNPNR